jgi:hypothetical protein
LRLEETETITAQNKLTDQSTKEVVSLLKDHLNDIQIRIIKLKNTEDIRVALELKNKLDALLRDHEKTIIKLSTTNIK